MRRVRKPAPAFREQENDSSSHMRSQRNGSSKDELPMPERNRKRECRRCAVCTGNCPI